MAGVVSWIAAAPHLDLANWQIAAGMVVAAATSHGRLLSPDMDQHKWLGKLIVGGHRGVTHFWMITALIYLAALSTQHVFLHWNWLTVSWFIYSIAVAWASHLCGDGIFGRIPIWFRLRRKGRSRWIYAGLGFKTGGLVEKAIAVPALIITGGWLLLSL